MPPFGPPPMYTRLPYCIRKQLGLPFVELVVTDADRVETDGVHELDRRLVVEQTRQERAAADQVAGADDVRVEILRPERLQMSGEVLGSAGRHVDR